MMSARTIGLSPALDLAMRSSEHRGTTPQTLAAWITGGLRTTLAQRGHALLAVSGGKSPVPVFEALSTQLIDWSRVTVILVDERVVPPDHPDSNTALVRRHLMRNEAAAARLVNLFDAVPDSTDDDSALDAMVIEANRRLADLSWPLDLVMLGMGEDAHTASLFPGAPGIERALTSPGPFAWVRPATAPHARLTLTLPAILAAREIALSIAGDAKKAVYRNALQGPDVALPISLVLCQEQTPVHVWTD